MNDLYEEIGKKVYQKHKVHEDVCVKNDIEDEKNLEAVKAQRVDDLLSGEAKKKQKAAKKAWKKQMKAVKK